jgi:hypothetical protein
MSNPNENEAFGTGALTDRGSPSELRIGPNKLETSVEEIVQVFRALPYSRDLSVARTVSNLNSISTGVKLPLKPDI